MLFRSRELENCVERAVALGNGQIMDLGDLPPSIAASSDSARPSDVGVSSGFDREVATHAVARSPQTPPSTTDLEDIERATIQRVFEQVNGDKALAGRMLGISRATLYRKLKRYNIISSSASSQSPTLQ